MYGGGNNTGRGRGGINGGGNDNGSDGRGGRLVYNSYNSGRGSNIAQQQNAGASAANLAHMGAAGVRAPTSSVSSGGYNNDNFNDLDDGIDWSSVPLPSDPTPTAASAAATSMASSSYSNPVSATTPTGTNTSYSVHNSVANDSSSHGSNVPSAHKQPQQQQQQHAYQQRNYNHRQQPQSARPSPPPAQMRSPPKPQNLYQRNNPSSSASSTAAGNNSSSMSMRATTTASPMGQANNINSSTSPAMVNGSGVPAEASGQAEMNTLRKQIEALTEQLRQKDDQLFELGSTLASVEIEANHRAENAEKKTRLAEEQLHRVQKEADAAHASLARQRKRAAAAANAAAVAAANAAAAGSSVEDSFVGRDLSSPLRAAVSPNRGQGGESASERGGSNTGLSSMVATGVSAGSMTDAQQQQSNQQKETSSSSAEVDLCKESEGGRVVTPPAGESSPTLKAATSESHLPLGKEIKRAGEKSTDRELKKQKVSDNLQSSNVTTTHPMKLALNLHEGKGWDNEMHATNQSRLLAQHLLLKDGLWLCSPSSPLLSHALRSLENDKPTPKGTNSGRTNDGKISGKNDTTSQFISFAPNWWKDAGIRHLFGDLTEANEDELKVRSILTRMAFGGGDHDDKINRETNEMHKQLGVDFLVRELIVMIVGKFNWQKLQSRSISTVSATGLISIDDVPCSSRADNNMEKAETHRQGKVAPSSTSKEVTSQGISSNTKCLAEIKAVPSSWLAVLKLLCIFREVLLLSSEARECTRVWLSSSSSVCPSGSEYDSSSVLDSPLFSFSSLSQRVRGINIDVKKARASVGIPCLAGGKSSDCQMSWERQNRSETCGSFIGILTKFSLGNCISNRNKDQCGIPTEGQSPSLMSPPMYIIERMLQREALLFILSHACDTKEGTGKSNILCLWYDILLPSGDMLDCASCNSSTTSSLGVIDKDPISDLVSVLEQNMDSSERRRLCHILSSDGEVISSVESDAAMRKRGRGQQRSKKRGRSSSSVPKKKSGCEEHNTFQNNSNVKNINKLLKMEVQCLSITLITRLISSSNSARGLFFRQMGKPKSLSNDSAAKKTINGNCSGRRVLAAVLDKLEVQILPSLRAGNSRSNLSSDCGLLLCLAVVRFMSSLCQNAEGVLLLRTQMRIPDDSDGHPQLSPSGIAVATSVLDCSVGAVYRHRHDVMPQYHGSQSPDFVSALWCTLLKEIVSFFGALLSHIQAQRHKYERNPKGEDAPVVVPFLAIISERKDVLLSCLNLMYYAGKCGKHGSEVDDNTINSVRKILEELSFDEEEEEEMKHA